MKLLDKEIANFLNSFDSQSFQLGFDVRKRRVRRVLAASSFHVSLEYEFLRKRFTDLYVLSAVANFRGQNFRD